jgi:hypothetical protein
MYNVVLFGLCFTEYVFYRCRLESKPTAMDCVASNGFEIGVKHSFLLAKATSSGKPIKHVSKFLLVDDCM